MHLSKHHALGNDFLVLLDLDGNHPMDGARAQALCDRHRGIGADGIIRVTAGADGADVSMELRNADGSSAETSGNGLACMAQAVFDAGVVAASVLTVRTGAGVKRLRRDAQQMRVDMGMARETDSPVVAVDVRKIAAIEVGNPHVVVLVHDPATQDLGAFVADANWEAITEGPEADAITMRVWERGVGETQACGTGACAAAYVANQWGLVGERVTVHQPGGDAVVELGDVITYVVTPEHIAHIEVTLT